MPSDVIKFRETKEFKETMRIAEKLLETNNKSDRIRILSHLGTKRLQEAFNTILDVTHTLNMSETEAFASSIKIFLLKAKKEQLKEIRQ